MPTPARTRQQRVPLLVLDGIAAAPQPEAAPWSPPPMAPRAPALDADARAAVQAEVLARLPQRQAGGVEDGMRRAAAREATGIWAAPQRPPRMER